MVRRLEALIFPSQLDLIIFHQCLIAAASGISSELRKVTVPGITTAACAAVYGNIISDDILCVDTTGGKGSCNVRRIIRRIITQYLIKFLIG